MTRLVALAVMGAAAAGCGDPTVDRPGGGQDAPDGAAPGPVAPQVAPVPERLASSALGLRGRAPGAARVFVRGAGNPMNAAVLPTDGSFCVGVEFSTPATYTLEVTAQSIEGQLSPPAVVLVTFDPTAPPAAGVSLCNGSAPTRSP